MKIVAVGKQLLFVGFLVVVAVVASQARVQAADNDPQVFVGADGEAKSELPTFGDATGLVGKVAEGGYGENVKNTNLQSVIGSIIKGALTLLGSLFLILMVYGGYNWMIASGDAERVKTTHDICLVKKRVKRQIRCFHIFHMIKMVNQNF
jgi:hypothetical protein